MIRAVRNWIDRHRIVAFLLVTYVFTWTIHALLVVLDLEATWKVSILVGFGGFGPPIGAAVVIWAAGGDLRASISQIFEWRVGLKWWAIAIGLPLLLLAVGSGLFVIFGGPIDLSPLPFVGIYLFVMAWGIVGGAARRNSAGVGSCSPCYRSSIVRLRRAR